jgi:glycosyltransferase involved in cell wall biosynthesis
VKIAYLNPGATVGGAEMVLLDVLASLGTSRPDAEPLVILGDDGPLRAEVEALGAICEVLPLPAGVARLGDAGGQRGGRGAASLAVRGAAASASTFGYARRLARRLRGFAPAVVQTNGMKMHLLGAWTAPRGARVVWHMHDYLSTRPAMARLLRASSRRSVEVVAVSQSVAADVRRVLPSRTPVRSIYNGVDPDRFRPDGPGAGDGAALDRAAGLDEAPPGTVRVGLVATFATWKGHDVFLEAAARIDPSHPARFYVVGGPIYRSAGSQVSIDGLKAHAEALGLTGRVAFTGHQADPARVMRGLDVVVHASTRPEPFGRVIVEAMACGRAVAAMVEGGAAELFHDGVDALGAPPRDPAALAAALVRLIDDADLRARLGRAGRAAALERFDRAHIAAEWAAVYDQSSLLERPPARRDSINLRPASR